jgi:glucose/arabinose dehydrogenase
MLPGREMPNTFDWNAIRGEYRRKAGFARHVAAALFTAALAACGGSGGSLTTSPPSLALSTFATGFTAPLGFETPDDGTPRNFVVEQRGTIRIIENGAVRPLPFLDISSRVESGGEKGLLGLAFHPDYRNSGRFFVNYTRRVNTQLQTVVAEFRVPSTGANQADPASERQLLVVDQPFDNHNGGQLAFGADGLLYIGLGDGGGSGDPFANGQNRFTLLGKMLRIDVDSPPAPGKQYAIPADNPFVSGGGSPEVYAWGLRNPFRFSFDAPTGRLFAGDVGEARFEEVDLIAKGENFGWNIMEGNHCFLVDPCNRAGLTPPIAEYAHDASGGISIIGGYVYRGSAISSLVGAYVFGDFTSGRVWALVERPPGSWQMTLVLTHGLTVSSFGRDRAGELYLVDYGNGAILRLRSAP